MPIVKEQFSRRATRDLRSSMALALRRHLEGLDFFNPSLFRFAEVYEEWPSYTSRYVPPAACVLPSSWKYADWSFSPKLLEDTWENTGEQGFALYKLSEVEVEFEVSLRTNSVGERAAIVLGVEESFVAPDVLMDDAAGARYGLILDLPEYYGLSARFALMAGRVIDDEDRAMREHRDAILTISAQAPQAKVAKVSPLSLNLGVRVETR